MKHFVAVGDEIRREGESGGFIAECRSERYAKRIVRTLNAHAALVEAARFTSDLIENFLVCEKGSDEEKAFDMLRAALELAEKGEK